MPTSPEPAVSQFVQSAFVQTAVARNVAHYRRKWLLLLDRANLDAVPTSDPRLTRAIAWQAGWNWPGFLFGAFWGIYRGIRHQWLVLALLIANMLAGAAFPGSVLDSAGYVVSLAVNLAYGLYGNAWLLSSLISLRHDDPHAHAPSVARLFAALIVFAFAATIAMGLGDEEFVSELRRVSI